MRLNPRAPCRIKVRKRSARKVAIDQKIDLHKRKRAILEELFKTLLHKLMTGEIRVADLDLSALAPAEKSEAAA